jgi:AsmA-like C-terminal region
LKLGAVAGFNGEAMRSIDLKMSRRNGAIKAFALNGKLGRDTPVTAELRSRVQGGREVVYLESNDAGAFFRFTDMYSKVVGGQMSLALEPPSADSSPKDGLLNVRDFTVKGEAALDRAAAGNPTGVQNGIFFSALRAEFTRQSGMLSVREGVVKGPTIGLTIEGNIDYNANQVRMSGTIVPVPVLNGIFAPIPFFGTLISGGSNEGMFAVTYEVVGTPNQPVMHINPISAILPGVTRKIMDFNTGKQYNQTEFPIPNN